MKNVICIDVRGTDGMLTLNQTYRVEFRRDNNYVVWDSRGYIGVYPAERFKPKEP